jgi:hypothetical protein
MVRRRKGMVETGKEDWPAEAYDLKVFGPQYNTVRLFVRHLAYHRVLWAARDRLTDHEEFWLSTAGGHLKLASLAWCKVFGSYREDIHWTKTPTGNTAQRDKDEFFFRVLLKTGFTEDQWNHYHKSMLAMRDKYVAHLDITDPITDIIENVPKFDAALQVVYVYEQWVREVIPVKMSRPTFSTEYELWKAEASSVVSQRPFP